MGSAWCRNRSTARHEKPLISNLAMDLPYTEHAKTRLQAGKPSLKAGHSKKPYRKLAHLVHGASHVGLFVGCVVAVEHAFAYGLVQGAGCDAELGFGGGFVACVNGFAEFADFGAHCGAD